MTTSRARVRTLIELGALVRERRMAAGLTLDEAAGLLRVGRRFLIELEHGTRRANVETLLQVLAGLGLELVIEVRTPGSTASVGETDAESGAR
jgi:transcriptional regulator with XRE-family HTH domain